MTRSAAAAARRPPPPRPRPPPPSLTLLLLPAGAPPLPLVKAFCASAKSWLLGGMEQVVAIHCKAGKGRTGESSCRRRRRRRHRRRRRAAAASATHLSSSAGVMACCLLMHLGHERSAADAIAFYNRERTRDGRGLTVPSQRRYVSYYERVLAGEAHSGDPHHHRTLRAVQATNVGGNQSNLRLSFRQHEVGLMARRPRTVASTAALRDGVLSACNRGVAQTRNSSTSTSSAVGRRLGSCEVRLEGDVLMAVAVLVERARSRHAAGAIIARCWLNVNMEPAAASFSIHTDKFQSTLDVRARRHTHTHTHTHTSHTAAHTHTHTHPRHSLTAAPPPPLIPLVNLVNTLVRWTRPTRAPCQSVSR